MQIFRLFAKCVLVGFLFITFPQINFAQDNLPQLIEKVEPSVVLVIAYDDKGKEIGKGSGFFIRNGHVITNYHVLEGADSAEIKLGTGKVYSVERIIAADENADLIEASVNVPRTSIRSLVVSDTTPKVGEKIVVIGNPLGLEKSVSDGIVSAIRNDEQLGQVIQITAPISPGSSGSPVVNLKGEVIGVISFLIRGGQNLNFAIPADKVITLGKNKAPGDSTKNKITSNPKEITNLELLLEYGNKLIDDKKYEQAIEALNRATELAPDDYRSFRNLAFIYNLLGNYRDALVLCNKSIRLDPQGSKNFYLLGRIYENLKRYTEAVSAYNQAIKVNSTDKDAFYGLGYSYFQLEKYSEATNAFEQVIKLDPNNLDAFIHLGLIYDELNHPQNAISAYKQAIRIDPNDFRGFLFFAMTSNQLEKYSEAITACKEAIKINSDDPLNYSVLGSAYFGLGLNKEAIDCYKQSIILSPSPTVYKKLGRVYEKVEDYPEAITAYKRAISLDPNDSDNYFHLGVIYEELKRPYEAINNLKETIKLKSDDKYAYYRLGRIYSGLKQYGESETAYKKALEVALKESDSEYVSILYEELGSFYNRQGLEYWSQKDYFKALISHKEAIKINSKDVLAHYWIGVNYFLLGRKDLALEEYKILKTLDAKRANELLENFY